MDDGLPPAVESQILASFFKSIELNQPETVRCLLESHKQLTVCKHRSTEWTYADPTTAMESYKVLGAYMGAMTGLQLSLLRGQDDMARDIIDATLSVDDLDAVCGGGNTALHVATFLGAKDIVRRLLERGCRPQIKNGKGFTPMDLVVDEETREVYASLCHQ